MKRLHINLDNKGYDIAVGRGLLSKAADLLGLDRKVLIVTDSGVPADYANTVAALCEKAVVAVLPQGEENKTLTNLDFLLRKMLENDFTRLDCVVAVGGGVVGDIAGFAAASYMRGIDFYNIPTTLLAQVDSSIGGKVAVDLAGVKNIVGAFWQPKAVLIDPDLLSSLPQRQIANGMAEAIKTGLIGDEVLFHIFENENAAQKLEEVIWRSLVVKKYVVEQDEREIGLRKTLNFGHTLGHAIETAAGLGTLLHGECVALGMIPMCETESLQNRLKQVLEKYDLPTSASYDKEKAKEALHHDKKTDGDMVTTVWVDLPGKASLKQMPTCEIEKLL